MPLDQGMQAYVYGSATGVWNVDWITFWGLMLFNTLGVTGVFENLRRWLISQGTLDIRVQTMLFAWAFGALLEGLVGFGYPWAVVAPILISLGLPDLDAIRVAAIANNAPVSYGALGAPIIAMAAVTGYPLLALSGSVGKVVAVLALLPPWVLIYLVSGKEGMGTGGRSRSSDRLATSSASGRSALFRAVSAGRDRLHRLLLCLLLLLKVWRPAAVLGHGGKPIAGRGAARRRTADGRRSGAGLDAVRRPGGGGRAVDRSVVQPAGGRLVHFAGAGGVVDHPGATIAAAFKFAPWVGGSAILASCDRLRAAALPAS